MLRQKCFSKFLSYVSQVVSRFYARCCNARLRTSIFWHGRVIPRLDYYVPLFGEWSHEFRNFLSRSKNLLILRRVPLNETGLAYSFDGKEEAECIRLRIRRRCIQKLFDDDPQATPHDLAIFLKGVRLAELYFGSTTLSCSATELCKSGNTQSVELLPCMKPPMGEWLYKSPYLGGGRVGGNLMPPVTVLQDSKHGQ